MAATQSTPLSDQSIKRCVYCGNDGRLYFRHERVPVFLRCDRCGLIYRDPSSLLTEDSVHLPSAGQKLDETDAVNFSQT